MSVYLHGTNLKRTSERLLRQHWYTVCPTRYSAGWLAERCSVSQELGAIQTHTTDTFLFISHTTKVLLFKFICNIFICVRIIEEMPGSIPSGTHCIKYPEPPNWYKNNTSLCLVSTYLICSYIQTSHANIISSRWILFQKRDLGLGDGLRYEYEHCIVRGAWLALFSKGHTGVEEIYSVKLC